MSTFTKTIGAATVGGLMAYFLDPDTGRRRRALVKDRTTNLINEADRAIGKAARDLSNRARGAVAEARSLLPMPGVSDDVLAEQVRSRIGRVISFPHFLEITARDGVITLRGAVLQSEADKLRSTVCSVRHVASLRNEVKTYKEPRDIPGLQQGQIRRRVPAAGWTPAARLAMGVTGGVLALAAAGRRGSLGKAARFAGIGLLARAFTNMHVRELLGISPGRGIHVQKTITIHAPLQKVFQFLSNYQNLPQFMSHLREIRRAGNNTSHWVAAGPAGAVEWDARIHRYEPNRLLAWKSLPGSAVRTAGILRLERLSGSATRVDLDLYYVPTAGALGHAVASLFGADPKKALDDDLNRLKTLLESGKIKGEGAAIPGFTSARQQAWEQAT
jgi:uncharacterized membrane protein